MRTALVLLAVEVAGALRSIHDPNTAQQTAKSKRQSMDNYMDVQYFANITVGGQEITGIVDTGSFELVVFESHCTGCGLAGKYNSTPSGKHSLGPLTRGLFYGSGDVYAAEAFDQVVVGPFSTINQSFWEAYEANMPVLNQARFQSIIGVGPPEMPSIEAWKQTLQSVTTVVQGLGKTGKATTWQTDRVLADMNFSVEISRVPVMLNSYSIEMFSLCLLDKPGRPGYFTWNDTSVHEYPTYFTRVPVLGKHTWAVSMKSVQLVTRTPNAMPTELACAEGCGAIVDSGTSLLMMPADVVANLQTMLKEMGAIDCRNLQQLPDLVFKLGDQIFSLPPDSYLTDVEEGSLPENMASFARIRRLNEDAGNECRISVMESYSRTELGPLWILGMPFFRTYYTSFKIGQTLEDRSLYIAHADSDCEPEAPESSLMRQATREVYHRRLDLKGIYHSPTVRKAIQGGDVEL